MEKKRQSERKKIMYGHTHTEIETQQACELSGDR